MMEARNSTLRILRALARALRPAFVPAPALALALSLCAASPCVAQLVAPDRALFAISTARFDIYFPAELRGEALRLASFADEVCAGLGSRFPDAVAAGRRYPVILADGVASLNASFSPFPSDRITILAAPAPTAFPASFDDDLKVVFTHELVHALSSSTRSGFWNFLAAVFGDPVAPALWTAPNSFIEGSAVASEARKGSGRGYDPLAANIIRQDILEGRFKDFWQAAGAWDAYPYGQLPYLYGGYFLKRQLELYGDEGFAELWKRIGDGNALAGVEGAPLMKGAFESTYGLPLARAWEEFGQSMAIREAVVMDVEKLGAEKGYITALAAGRDRLFWSDAAAGTVFASELSGSLRKRLFPADTGIGRLDASPDGYRLLVSWSRVRDGVERPMVLTWDLDADRFESEELAGLREAAFAGSDAIVAIAVENWRTDLVILRKGESKLLLRGGPARSYSMPVSPDGRTVYCLATDSGRQLLLRVDAETGLVEALVPGIPLEHMRFLGLQVSGAKRDEATHLSLAFAPEGSLYRSALISDSPGGESATIDRQETQLSGSVLFPALAGDGKIYYLAHLSDGEYLCRYPDENPALLRKSAAATWAPLDPSFQRPSPGTGEPALDVSRASALPLLGKTLRFPSVSPNVDAAGVALFGADIAERAFWSIDAQYSWALQAANASLALSFGLKPWSLALGLGDNFEAQAEGGSLRKSAARIDLTRTWTFLPARRQLVAGFLAKTGASAPAIPGSAYASAWTDAGAGGGLSLRYQEYRGAFFPPFAASGFGADAAFDGEWNMIRLADPLPILSFEAGADAALPFLGIQFLARLAASPDGKVLFGPASRVLSLGYSGGSTYPFGQSILSPRYTAYAEYGSINRYSSLYAFGEASCALLDAELQRRVVLGPVLSPLYFQRLLARAGLRGAFLGGSGVLGADLANPLLLSSVFARAELIGSPLVAGAAQIRCRAGVEISWAFASSVIPSPFRIALILGLSL